MSADRSPRGFTLVEMVIALSLATLLLTMALPTLEGRITRQRLQAVAQHLAADLAQARHEAARLGQPVHVVFKPGSQWCYALALHPQADCQGQPGTDPQLLKAVHGADNPGLELVDALPITIEPREGRPQAGFGLVQWRSRGGVAVRVQLSPLGRANLCTPGPALAGVAACAAALPH